MLENRITKKTATLGLILLLSLSACGESKQPDERSRSSASQYPLRGEIVRLEPKTQIAVIKHEDIPGWMEAMTMQFPVESRAEFQNLRPGLRIRATVFVKDLDYWIADIVSEAEEP
jgi:protein SCO1